MHFPSFKTKHALKALLLYTSPGSNFSRCTEGFQEKQGATGSTGAPCWIPGAAAPAATRVAGSADGPQQPRRFTGPHASGGPRGVRTSPGRAALPVPGGTAGSVPPAGWRGKEAGPGRKARSERRSPPRPIAPYGPGPRELRTRSGPAGPRKEPGRRPPPRAGRRNPRTAQGGRTAPRAGGGTDLQHGGGVSTEARL